MASKTDPSASVAQAEQAESLVDGDELAVGSFAADVEEFSAQTSAGVQHVGGVHSESETSNYVDIELHRLVVGSISQADSVVVVNPDSDNINDSEPGSEKHLGVINAENPSEAS